MRIRKKIRRIKECVAGEMSKPFVPRLALTACLIRTYLNAHLKTLSKVSQAASELSGSDAAVFFGLC